MSANVNQSDVVKQADMDVVGDLKYHSEVILFKVLEVFVCRFRLLGIRINKGIFGLSTNMCLHPGKQPICTR